MRRSAVVAVVFCLLAGAAPSAGFEPRIFLSDRLVSPEVYKAPPMSPEAQRTSFGYIAAEAELERMNVRGYPRELPTRTIY